MIIEIKSNISKNISFLNSNTYIIVGEIHVLSGVSIYMENNVQIFIRNGDFPTSTIKKSALIFDTGSSLNAGNVYIKACDSNNVSVGVANNGGIWFLGSAGIIDKDGITTTYSPNSSNFIAAKIFTYFLGSKDPVKKAVAPSADQDAITVLACGNNEWNVKELISDNSGDNGIDVVLSYITLNNINVSNSGEDGVNLQSSKVNVNQRLKVLVPLTSVFDRDIFDFEANDAASYLRIAKGVQTNLQGIFGDQLSLVSNDLPQPTTGVYNYNATTSKGQSYIYLDKPEPL